MIPYEASRSDECTCTARLTLSPFLLLVTDGESGLMTLAGGGAALSCLTRIVGSVSNAPR